MQTAQYTRLWSELQNPRQVSGLITVICVKFLGLITGAEPIASSAPLTHTPGEDRFQTLAESVRRVLAGDVGSTTLAPEVASDNILPSILMRLSLVICLIYPHCSCAAPSSSHSPIYCSSRTTMPPMCRFLIASGSRCCHLLRSSANRCVGNGTSSVRNSIRTPASLSPRTFSSSTGCVTSVLPWDSIWPRHGTVTSPGHPLRCSRWSSFPTLTR